MGDPTPSFDFRCEEDQVDAAVPPAAASHRFPRIRKSGWVHAGVGAASECDPMVADAFSIGWFVYPPEPVHITAGASPGTSLGVANGEQYVQRCSGDNDEEPGEVFIIDTLWYVDVPDGYVLLVVPPLYQLESNTLPRVIEGDSEWGDVRVPVRPVTDVTYHSNEPIAQLLPFPVDCLRASWDSGEFDTAGEAGFDRYTALGEVFRAPYRDWIRSENPTTPTLD